MIHGSSPDGVLWGACVSLVAFAAVGGVVGGIADWIVEGSVRAQIEADVAARQAGEADKPRGNSESQVQ